MPGPDLQDLLPVEDSLISPEDMLSPELKPAIVAESRVGPPGEKKKGKEKVPERKRSIEWADMSGQKLEQVELFHKTQWLANPKQPKHLKTKVPISDPGEPSAPSSSEQQENQSVSNSDGKPVKSGEPDTTDKPATVPPTTQDPKKAVSAGSDKSRAAPPLSAKAAKKAKQKAKAQALQAARDGKSVAKPTNASDEHTADESIAADSTAIPEPSESADASDAASAATEAGAEDQVKEDGEEATEEAAEKKKRRNRKKKKNAKKSAGDEADADPAEEDRPEDRPEEAQHLERVLSSTQAAAAPAGSSASASGAAPPAAVAEKAGGAPGAAGPKAEPPAAKKAAKAPKADKVAVIATVLIQSGRDQVTSGSKFAQMRQHSRAGVDYEAAVRSFRQASAALAAKGAAGDDSPLRPLWVQAVAGEAGAWKKAAYVYALSDHREAMVPAALRAYTVSMRLYRRVGQMQEVGVVLADLGRVQLAEERLEEAGGTLRQAARVLHLVGEAGAPNLLERASAMQYMGELKVQVHMRDLRGWQAAQAGAEEDSSLMESAVADLRAAERIFASKGRTIPSKVLASVRWSLGQASLLAGRVEEAKCAIAECIEDASWRAANQEAGAEAERLFRRLHQREKVHEGAQPAAGASSRARVRSGN